jgi:hypothetical protein
MACSALAACGSPSGSGAPASSPTPAPPPAVTTAEPVHIETNGDGGQYITVVQRVAGPAKQTRIAYALRAASSQADIVGKQSIATFVEPHVTFFDRQGKPLIADSPQAKITQQDKSVLMSGGVRAQTVDGSVLTCDTLRYDGRTAKLHGAGHVVLASPGGVTLSGNYLEGDVRLDDVRVSARPL